MCLVGLVLFLHAPRTMTEDALMEEEEQEMNDSTEATKKIKAQNNKADEDSFRELESPEDDEPLLDSPILITDTNWRQLDKGEWLIEFYAPWCPACRSLQPRWDQLARDVKAFNEVRVRIAKCDVTANPWLTGRMMIASLPTIFHIKEKEYRKYTGSRSAEDLYDYLLKKKWQDTPVLEKWREPHGAAMTAMSGFYKLANVVQSIHDTMTLGYGFPVWASYVIFGLVTLACGLTAGLIIVCCMDCLSTPTTPERRAAIIEKNRRAREERERQAKLAEELEKQRKEAEEKRGAGAGRGDADEEEDEEGEEGVKTVKSYLRSEKRSKRRKQLRRRARLIKQGVEVEEIEKNEKEEEMEMRKRFGYSILDEDEGALSTDEELYADSDEDHLSTETTETEATETEEEDYEDEERPEDDRKPAEAKKDK